jgi:hypothetical protein
MELHQLKRQVACSVMWKREDSEPQKEANGPITQFLVTCDYRNNFPKFVVDQFLIS